MKIDAHHHFWKYDPVRYSWMNESMEILKKDYQPADLQVEIEKAEIGGVVSVQADQSLLETDELLDHATENDFIKGVVGWFPLADPAIEEVLAEYADNPWLKGVRHVVQDEPDDRFILGEAFNEGIRKLEEFDLIYDILIYERQLGASIEFVDLHPNLPFVLDHVAKPRIGDGLMEPWKEQMFEMSRRENVTCKLSGMATEAKWAEWTSDQLRPYMEVALDAFGPDRLMFGSDWPVARLAVDYMPWVNLCREFISSLSTDEREAIEGGNATRVYRLD
ncbi:MAG: amidohydrolase [Opitutae bacterium]|nr:amidohydrolase [Opitutae bacterium]|tara:strand:- start:11056 stop:11886 length:831 start_codon:yes stop_codon:yes gene_type:complete